MRLFFIVLKHCVGVFEHNILLENYCFATIFQGLFLRQRYKSPDVHYTQLTCVSFLICIENDKFFFLLFFSEVYFLRCLNPRSRMLKDFIICCHVTTKNLFHTWLMIRQKQRTNAILGKNETSSHDDPRSFQGRLSAIRSLSIIIKR